MKGFILTIANIVSLVGAIYYMLSGFNHLFTSGNSSQPTLAAACTIVFLTALITAIRLTPAQPTRCPRCGTPLVRNTDKREQ